MRALATFRSALIGIMMIAGAATAQGQIVPEAPSRQPSAADPAVAYPAGSSR